MQIAIRNSDRQICNDRARGGECYVGLFAVPLGLVESTKAGLDGFFLGLGEALRDHGVRVLVVRPGFVKSKMTAGLDEIPLSVTPDDVAEAITDAIQGKRELIWVPGTLRAVMSGLRHVPRPLFRRLPL